jgi:hypothetical protein
VQLLARFFNQKGVEPESVFFNDKLGQVFVRATESDQSKVEKLIEKIVLGKDVPVYGSPGARPPSK